MSRNHFTLGILAVAFTLLLVASDADARLFRNQNRNDGCCQNSCNSGYRFGQHYHSRHNRGNCCAQQASCAPATACCNVAQNQETSDTVMQQAPAPAPAPAPVPVQEPETPKSND
ncbi:MAG: hypothetical protein ABIK07_27265 [Planctomycetota bacterium]|uniref:hypothetical protein n=1 Tax=uncultured Gimesia sp. TaxID=1678688 RepID=UPI0026062C7B|nr:hypothetical protein [uncultured Gimesia sp.]